MDEERGELIQIASNAGALSRGDVIFGWLDDEDFRDFFIAELAATAYPAFFWEMPPVTHDSLSAPFECALIRSEALARMRADESDFAEYLTAVPGSVASFPNLGGDALLIAPSKVSSADCYAHFAAFLRDGQREQQHALFQRLVEETEKLLQAGRRFWISTSGLGVPWVHVRLDSYPKYYQYRPYAEG